MIFFYCEKLNRTNAQAVHPDTSGRTEFCCPREPQAAERAPIIIGGETEIKAKITNRKIPLSL